MIRTADVEVVIESREGDLTVYRNIVNGLRWSVRGTCDRRGFCMVGAVIDGVTVESVGHLGVMCLDRGEERIDSLLDVPLGPGYDSNCCPMDIEILDGK